jgi:hypothetical protein
MDCIVKRKFGVMMLTSLSQNDSILRVHMIGVLSPSCHFLVGLGCVLVSILCIDVEGGDSDFFGITKLNFWDAKLSLKMLN